MHPMAEVRTMNMTLDLCLRAGELLMASGAGAADVTVLMQSIAEHYEMGDVEIDVTFTSLSMSYQYAADEPPLLQMRQVKLREIDYEDLTAVDHLVRDVLADREDLAAARARVARIAASGHATPRWRVTVGWGVMCGAVGLMLGGGWGVILVAFLAAMMIDLLQFEMESRRLPSFYRQVAGGLVASLMAVAGEAVGLPLSVAQVITASIIMLLAGVGFMGAIQDALTGFYITSGARILEAMLSTAGIIGGVSAGLTVGRLLGVNSPEYVPSIFSWQGAGVMFSGAALAAGAFAFACYAPRRSILPVALIAGVAILVFNVVDAGFGRAWAAGAAAFVIGVVSFSVSGRVKIPPLIVVVSGVTPMLPGLSIYRGLSLISEGGLAASSGFLSLLTAASVAIALSSGVILGEYVAQPLKRNARKIEIRLSGPRLVGPPAPDTVPE